MVENISAVTIFSSILIYEQFSRGHSWQHTHTVTHIHYRVCNCPNGDICLTESSPYILKYMTLWTMITSFSYWAKSCVFLSAQLVFLSRQQYISAWQSKTLTHTLLCIQTKHLSWLPEFRTLINTFCKLLIAVIIKMAHNTWSRI